jgi:hypothetical protein
MNNQMQVSNKLNTKKDKLFEQTDLFDRVLQKASPKVRQVNNKVVARISEIEKIKQLSREFEERRKLNEREEDEERQIWYEILDNEVMAQELAGIAEGWFLEWALAVYKDLIQSDAMCQAYTEYQMLCEQEVEIEIEQQQILVPGIHGYDEYEDERELELQE